jgi:hypothetical protein
MTLRVASVFYSRDRPTDRIPPLPSGIFHGIPSSPLSSRPHLSEHTETRCWRIAMLRSRSATPAVSHTRRSMSVSMSISWDQSLTPSPCPVQLVAKFNRCRCDLRHTAGRSTPQWGLAQGIRRNCNPATPKSAPRANNPQPPKAGRRLTMPALASQGRSWPRLEFSPASSSSGTRSRCSFRFCRRSGRGRETCSGCA